MKARKLLSDACYSSSQLKVLTKAFDDAWEQIAASVGSAPKAIEAARLKLADIILALHDSGAQDSARMTQSAVKEMLAPPTRLA